MRKVNEELMKKLQLTDGPEQKSQNEDLDAGHSTQISKITETTKSAKKGSTDKKWA
jgi:hypothetical protein